MQETICIGYKWYESLDRHVATHGEKQFYCSECGKGLFHNSGLRAHRRRHNDEKTYGCSHYDRKFCVKLEIHNRIYTGERSHKYGNCNKSFISSSSLCDQRRIQNL